MVVHCAGDVSFDPPIQEAFDTNVLGVRGLLDRIAARPSGPRRPLRAHLHRLRRRSAARAGPRGPGRPHGRLSGRDRRGACGRAGQIEDALPRGRRAGEAPRQGREASTAGPGRSPPRPAPRPTAATWVRTGRSCARQRAGPHPGLDRRLHLHQGDGRAGRRGAAAAHRRRDRSHRAAEHHRVRPRTPYPGWIEGFKMAEPLILAFGRGELPEFPAAARLGRRHRAGRPRRRRDHGGAGDASGGRRSGLLPRLVRRAQPAGVPAALRAGPRVLRPAPVRHGRARRGPAAGLALPRRRKVERLLGKASAPTGSPTARRARAAQRPRAAICPRPGPAGAAAGVPAPLPRPLPRVRRSRAAVRRRQHAARSSRPRPGRPGDRSASTRPTSTGTTTCATSTAPRSPSRCASTT